MASKDEDWEMKMFHELRSRFMEQKCKIQSGEVEEKITLLALVCKLGYFRIWGLKLRARDS